jgi:hypothetical protein
MRTWSDTENCWYVRDVQYLLLEVCEDRNNFGKFLTPEGSIELVPLVYFVPEEEIAVYKKESRVT